ncbi:MAG: EAL domain-containing protein [Gammaproteobacteria bacterium]|nr:EAL domain-containing protein [Gammaproteobacteria bacterium]
MFSFLKRSLRLKLIATSVLVEAVMLTILVSNSLRLIQHELLGLTQLRQHELEHLLNTALAAPLVQRDYATLKDIMDKSLTDEGIVYLVLFDDTNTPVVASNWNLNTTLPPVETSLLEDLDDPLHRFDSSLRIKIAGTQYGLLRYGISTRFLHEAKQRLLRESLVIATMEVGLSIIMLAALGIWLTRHLSNLTEASTDISRGEFTTRLEVHSEDEVGQLTRTFNAMALAIRQRIEELSQNEAKFHAIADYTYDWETWHGPDHNLVWINPSVERMTGYNIAQCMQMERFPFPIIHCDDRSQAVDDFTIHTHASTGTARFRIIRNDGSMFWAHAAWQPIYNNQGQYQGIRSSIRDISDQIQVELTLQEKLHALGQSEDQQRQLLLHSQQEHARMVALLSAMRLGILFETTDNRIAYYNPAFLQIWMIDPAIDLSGRSTDEVLALSTNILSQPDHFSRHIMHVAGTHEVSDNLEVEMSDGRVITQLCYIVRDAEGRFLGRLWIYEDVTRERQTAEQLIYLAERDPLTGLFNRRRFEDELARAISISVRRKVNTALLFFDLDEFKYINDTYGHRAGDAMLIRVGHEASALIRESEFISRLGGDEFAILMPDASLKEAEQLAERVIRAIYQIPFRFEGRNLRLTTSVGIAMYPQHASEQDELIAHADAAMYQAKEAGKNAWRVYRSDLDTSRLMLDRLSWVTRIAQALEHNLLRLHYQGIYYTNTGKLAHVEVLVRMVDEEHHNEIIMPGRFIPFAEKSGQIFDIDRWVIRNSIALIANVPNFPNVPVSVNISGRSFDAPSLPQYIADQLEYFNVAPEKLLVELTETSAISDLHDAQRFIESLQQTGCQVCLDDFGAGFSSFTYLKHLKANLLKIDGQFIRDLPNDHDNQTFVKAIVDVAKGLHKKTIAEFVENHETLIMLQQLGVDMVQGYYLHKPSAEPPTSTVAAIHT